MKKVLFVCLGNICRSPAAEGIFKNLIKSRNVADLFIVDSCGTSGYHEGQKADKRMRAAAVKRGIELTSFSRALRSSDFEKFDYILAMDNLNYRKLLSRALTKSQSDRIYKMCDYVYDLSFDEVPDPFYGGENGFETVLDILEEGTENLLREILN
ncbi:MAG: low molecular weight phosphotyrosine protein phosphatase [Bacteriovoracaceae bacterium]|jgi:protein-tyrosine phosphatase|nr:low molecular weight phosphotyrosine protein phosphatase [Bacteriovoracaceae bacterium]